VEKTVGYYENYSFPDLIREFETLVDDVSNWYVRISRRRFWKNTLDQDKQDAYETLYFAIGIITRVMAPVIPFLTEHIWQNLVLKYGEDVRSVHLSGFPVPFKFDIGLLERTKRSGRLSRRR
jgi:isoleucyl-tRNA synthetase